MLNEGLRVTDIVTSEITTYGDNLRKQLGRVLEGRTEGLGDLRYEKFRTQSGFIYDIDIFPFVSSSLVGSKVIYHKGVNPPVGANFRKDAFLFFDQSVAKPSPEQYIQIVFYENKQFQVDTKIGIEAPLVVQSWDFLRAEDLKKKLDNPVVRASLVRAKIFPELDFNQL